MPGSFTEYCANRIESPLHDGTLSGRASHTMRGGPPSTDTVFSLSSAKYAIDFESRDQPAENAFWAMSRFAPVRRSCNQSADTESFSIPKTTRYRPSGDSETGNA